MDEHEQEALRRVSGGDAGGLEFLVARYQRKAIQTAFLITRDRALAEDAAQEVFVRLFTRRLPSYDPRREFAPYLMRSVVNAALTLAEKTRRWQPLPETERAEAKLVQLFQRAPSAEQQAEYAELKRLIYNALGQLSPRQRAAIVQRYYLEMSEQEMSQALDAPPGTVKWLLNAARKRMNKVLRRTGFGPSFEEGAKDEP